MPRSPRLAGRGSRGGCAAPEAAGRSAGLYPPDPDPKPGRREASRGGPERRQELGRCAAGAPGRRSAASASTRSALRLDPDQPARARGRRGALRDEGVPGRRGPGQPELGLEPEPRAASGRRSPIRSIGRAATSPDAPDEGSSRAPADRSAGPTSVAPSGPASTAQLEPAARRPGVEVAERRRRDERLGQLGDPPDEVGAPVRIELAEHVVEQEERRAIVERGQDVELGQLEGEDRRALLAARGEPGEVAPLELERRGRRGGARRASSRSRPPSRPSRRAAGRARRATDSPGRGGAFVS